MVRASGAPRRLKRGLDDLAMDGLAYGFLGVAGLACVLPIIAIVGISFTPMTELVKAGGFSLIPKSFDPYAYQILLKDAVIPRGFMVSVFLVIVGTSLNLTLTGLLAYPLSVRELPGRKAFMLFLVFTMMFSGGIVPTFFVVRMTGIMDTVWAMIVPGLIYASNVIIMKIFFEQLPLELYESARMDGAGEFRILWRIALPLSLPVLATVGLFYGVGHWNQFFEALLYITDPLLKPLQLLVREMILDANRVDANIERVVPILSLRMAAAVSACVPVLVVYPFLQRYFVKGLVVGAVKG